MFVADYKTANGNYDVQQTQICLLIKILPLELVAVHYFTGSCYNMETTYITHTMHLTWHMPISS